MYIKSCKVTLFVGVFFCFSQKRLVFLHYKRGSRKANRVGIITLKILYYV